MKRQRLDDAATEPSPSPRPATPSAEVGLPAEMWAHVLKYVYLDDVLTCTAVSKFFQNDVTGQMKMLWIRSGASMDVAPAVIERFSRVEKVNIYPIRNQTTLDCEVLQNTTPFISRLPNLTRCFVGCLGGRHEESYEFEVEYDEPNADEKWAGLIQSVCKAYRMGRFSETIKFRGLIPCCDDIDDCPWKYVPKIESYRDDVPCQLCDMICTSLPPREVLNLDKHEIPCIGFSNVVKAIRCRYEMRAEALMTSAIVDELESSCGYLPVLCPPDYASTRRNALGFEEPQLERIQSFIANGGNAKHPSIHRLFLDKSQEWYRDCFIGFRRVIELETYDRLKDLGFDLNEKDFVAISRSDERASVVRYEMREAKKQLETGVAIRNITAITDAIKRWAPLDHALIVLSLEGRLGMDLSDHKEAIRSFAQEYERSKESN